MGSLTEPIPTRANQGHPHVTPAGPAQRDGLASSRDASHTTSEHSDHTRHSPQSSSDELVIGFTVVTPPQFAGGVFGGDVVAG